MELDRSHLHITSTGICSATTAATTTTHLSLSSNSSMKLTKSILSPIRATRHGGAVSLSFLSRHLRAHGGLRGGKASSFFAATGKKRGGGVENTEPSSPKVTCIGQVRVKSKRKVKQYGSLSKRRIKGDVSFRKIEQSRAENGDQQSEDKALSSRPPPQRYSNGSAHYQQQLPQERLPHRNQRWVHLPISVCEALRAFGAEFSCLFPCRKSCFSTSEREKAEKSQYCANESRRGAVLDRWLVAVNAGAGGGGRSREIELVVGGGDEEGMSIGSSRRHVFEDIEVKDDRVEVKGHSLEGGEEEEEASRVSICLPPENALLLMRCRSDPMKMAALAPRFSWDAHAAVPEYGNENVKEENHDEDFEGLEEVRGLGEEGKEKTLLVKKNEVFEQAVEVSVEEQKIQNSKEANLEMEVGDHDCDEELDITSEENEQEIDADEDVFLERENEESESNMSSFEALLDQEKTEHYEDCPIEVSSAESHKIEAGIEKGKEQETEESSTSDKETTFVNYDKQNQVMAKDESESEAGNQEWVISNIQEAMKEKERPVLPECLLLMMCEPKLSMEVSKETWVCSMDFVRRLPERPRKPAKAAATTSGGHHNAAVKRRQNTDSRPKPKPSIPAPPTKKSDLQPARSSCSLPAAASMAAVIEQKLVNAGAYEPFALTRCKSEPMRTAAAKLVPESCFNASMKLEPRLGVGAAGVGF